MKVLFIQPPMGDTIGLNSVFLAEPLGLEMIASCLELEHECKILDMRVDKELDSHLDHFRPHACGISCSFTPDLKRTIKIARTIKDKLKGCFVFAGGHHASQRPQDFIGSPVDAVVLGNGEEVCMELIRKLENGERPEGLSAFFPTSRPTGVADEVLDVAFPEMKGLPLPARHLVERYRQYYQMGLEWPVYSVETARGCPYHCRFCSVWDLYGGRRRDGPEEDILNDLISIKGKHVFFTDDLFFLDAERSESLALEIRKAKIKKYYTCQARADWVVKNRGAVRLWKEAGLKRIFIGLESASDHGLKRHKKGYGSNVNEEALYFLEEVGVSVNGQFIVEPDFTLMDFKALMDYVLKRKIAFPSFTILTPLPGTDLYRERKEDLITEDPEMFDLFHSVLPTRIPLKSFYREFAMLYRESYFRRSIKLPSYRILRYLTSPDRIKRLISTTRNLRALCDPDTYIKAHSKV